MSDLFRREEQRIRAYSQDSSFSKHLNLSYLQSNSIDIEMNELFVDQTNSTQ